MRSLSLQCTSHIDDLNAGLLPEARKAFEGDKCFTYDSDAWDAACAVSAAATSRPKRRLRYKQSVLPSQLPLKLVGILLPSMTKKLGMLLAQGEFVQQDASGRHLT